MKPVALLYTALLCAQLTACSDDSSERPQLLVALYSDLEPGSQLTRVEVEILDSAGKVADEDAFDIDADGVEDNFLLSFGVRRAKSNELRLRVRGRGRSAAEPEEHVVIERSLRARFSDREAMLLRVFLGQSCFERSCGEGTSCDPLTAACEPVVEQEVSPLSRWDEATAWLPADYDYVPPVGPPPACDPAKEDCPDLRCQDAGECMSLRALGAACEQDDECSSTHCVDGVCCESACEGPCDSCDASGVCSGPDLSSNPDHCGGCELACSGDHITPTCSASECTGECASGYRDCDMDKRKNGCEVELATDADHCGECDYACPYGVCEGGKCAGKQQGAITRFTATTWQGLHYFAIQVTVSTPGTLVALGLLAKPSESARVRVGLYADVGLPDAVIAQTGDLALASAEIHTDREGVVHGVEELVEPVQLEGDGATYWLVMQASEDVEIYVNDATRDAWWSRNELSYGPLEQSFPGDSELLMGPNAPPLPNLYLVLVP